MEFEYSKKTKMYMEQLQDFMTKYIYPNEKVFHDQVDAGPTRWQVPPIMEELKAKARERGLWNLFLPESERGAGLTNLEYAPLCEIMGRSPIAPEAFNCSAPDTGNMETIERYGTEAQKQQWLQPLLEGKIRSAFIMPELHHLWPLITYESPSRTIDDSMFVASDEATFGSVMMNAERILPSSSGWSHCFFCSGEP